MFCSTKAFSSCQKQATARNCLGIELSRLTENSDTHLGAPRAERGANLPSSPLGTTVLYEETTIRNSETENTSWGSSEVPRWEGGGEGEQAWGSAGAGRRGGGDRVDSQIQKLTDPPRARHRGRPGEPLPWSQGRPNAARDRPSTPAPARRVGPRDVTRLLPVTGTQPRSGLQRERREGR